MKHMLINKKLSYEPYQHGDWWVLFRNQLEEGVYGLRTVYQLALHRDGFKNTLSGALAFNSAKEAMCAAIPDIRRQSGTHS